MAPFVKSKEFKDLNVGFALDEGKLKKNYFMCYFLTILKSLRCRCS